MLYTIGYSNLDIYDFLDLLKKFEINCLCDVRSVPYSKYMHQFNREQLLNFMKKNCIQYIFFGEEFGARRDEIELNTDGYVDFEKVTLDGKFLQGIRRIMEGLAKGYNIALMCSEKDPIDCHRSILISRVLKDKSLTVNHILVDGTTKSQEEIEEELVNRYFPNKDQLNLFESKEPEELVREAYRIANREIGFRKEMGKEDE